MKRFKTLAIIVLLIVLVSCAALAKTNKYEASLIQDINLIVSNWDTILSNSDLSYENINSWLPNSGIRGRYELLRNNLSIRSLEQIFGLKVFLKGPHMDDINLKSIKEFGYYNPEFIDKLKQTLKSVYENQKFIESTQLLYNSRLKQYLRTYYLAYDIAANNEEIMNGYLNAISNPNKDSYMNGRISGPSYYLQESFREFAQSIGQRGYDIYEGFICPGFWIRRSIDGTQSHFYELLILTMKHYDNEFLSEQRNIN